MPSSKPASAAVAGSGTRTRPMSVTPSSISACGNSKAAPGTRCVHRIRVRTVPVVRCHVGKREAGSGFRHRRGDLGMGTDPRSLTVATTPASSISRTHWARLVGVSTVVTVVDADARSVRTAARVEPPSRPPPTRWPAPRVRAPATGRPSSCQPPVAPRASSQGSSSQRPMLLVVDGRGPSAARPRRRRCYCCRRR